MRQVGTTYSHTATDRYGTFKLMRARGESLLVVDAETTSGSRIESCVLLQPTGSGETFGALAHSGCRRPGGLFMSDPR